MRSENQNVTTFFVSIISCFVILLFVSCYFSEQKAREEINEYDTIRLQTFMQNIVIDNKSLKEDNNQQSIDIINNGNKIIDLYKMYKKPLTNKDFIEINNLYDVYYKSYDKYISEENNKNIYKNIDNLIKNN